MSLDIDCDMPEYVCCSMEEKFKPEYEPVKEKEEEEEKIVESESNKEPEKLTSTEKTIIICVIIGVILIIVGLALSMSGVFAFPPAPPMEMINTTELIETPTI